MTISKKVITTLLLCVMMLVLLYSPAVVLAEEINSNSSDEQNKEVTAIATSNEVQEVLTEEMLERAGVKLYASEEEYLAEQKTLGQQLLAEVESYMSEPIWHTFTVRDRKTGNPISGAVVLIDGVPRFSDVNGQILVKVLEDVVELRVEKEGYNPYVEYYDVYDANENGIQEKTVQLKSPSDDLEIYSAIVDYEGDKANIVEQSYTFDKMESYDDVINITIESNDADRYYLYNGNTLIAESVDGNFTNINVKDIDSNINSRATIEQADENLKVVTEKNGIFSNTVSLKTDIVEITDLGADEYLEFDLGGGLSLGVDDNQLVGNLDIDILDILKEELNIKPSKLNALGSNIQYVYDNQKGTYKFTWGVDLGFTDDNLKKLERKNIYRKFEKSYKMRRNNINPKARKQSVCESLWGAFKKVSNDSKKDVKLKAWDINVSIPLEFISYIEISHKGFTGEVSGKDAVVAGGIELSLGFHIEGVKHFFVTTPIMPIPFYINIGLGGTIGIDWDYEQVAALQHTLKLIASGNLKFGLGIGIYGLLSAGVYGQGDIEFIFDLLGIEDIKSNIYLSCGVLVSILGFDLDYKIIDKYEIEIMSTQLQTLRANSVGSVDNNYMDARPSSAYVNGKKLTVWIERDNSRDQYNQTKLMYSYGDKVGSVYDDGKADYYPELSIVGDDIYVVWHKNSRVFNAEDTVSNVFNESTVMISKFNIEMQQFEMLNQFNTGAMATLPKIAKGNPADGISVLWLNNTEGNPLGNTGVNNIYSSTLKNSIWSAPEVVFTTDKPITSYDASFVNGELYVASAVDIDADFSTQNDIDIFFGISGNANNISNDSAMQSNPKFGKVDDKPVLYYIQNNSIYMSWLDGEESVLVAESISSISNYEVISGSTNEILYLTTGETGQELYSVIYDTNNQKWSNSVMMEANYEYISVKAVLNANDIEIDGVTFTVDEEGKSMMIDGVQTEIVSTINDIELIEAYLLDAIKLGENCIYLNVKNNGSYAIESFDYSINGISGTFDLESAIEPKEEKIVMVKWYCNMLLESVNVTLNIDNEDILSNNAYAINVNYADLSMDVHQVYQDGKESLNIQITNELSIEEEFVIIIRKDNRDGEIVYRSDAMAIGANGNTEVSVTLDYNTLGCEQYDKLYIEIMESKELLIPCVNVIIVDENVQHYTTNQIGELSSLLSVAKRVLGGII